MYEAIKVGKNTYYIDSPNRVGIYLYGNSEACLIDSGNDESAGKKAVARVGELGASIKSVFITHSHADHIGGCAVIQKRTGCKIYAPGELEFSFVGCTRMQSVYMGGCFPFAEYRDNKFYKAQPFEASPVTSDVLPEGLECENFCGHSPNMCAYRTDDGVWFLGDIVWGENIIEKYGMTYQFDIASHLEALEKVCGLEGSLFVASHAEPTDNIKPLAIKNRDKVLEVVDFLYESCKGGVIFDDLLGKVFTRFNIPVNIVQHCFTGGIARSYLSYMHDRGMIEFEADMSNRLVWKSV